MISGLQDLAFILKRKTAWFTTLALLCMFVFHLRIAYAVQVPRVAGFQEIVAFLRKAAADQMVFYEGHYNGVFSFYLRAEDDQFRRGVVLGSKLLYSTNIEPKFGLVERVSSPADVVQLFRRECGCKFLVVERDTSTEIQAKNHLRQALTQADFRLVRSFRIESPTVTDADVYEYLGNVSMPLQYSLHFPRLGEKSLYLVRPIEHSTPRQSFRTDRGGLLTWPRRGGSP